MTSFANLGLLLLIVAAGECIPVNEVTTEIETLSGSIVTYEERESNTTINLDGEGTEPSNTYKEEVAEYFRQQKNKNLHQRVTRQNSAGSLRHGDTIGLQTFVRSYWASCGGSPCGRHSCPRMQMTGTDWTNCWGEVFKIYRASGSGQVRVGDLVGLYFPRQSGTWVGCASSTCAKATCPGNPTSANGFSTGESWYRCWGEVFKIYAKGKSSGAVINSNDEVAFYYLQDRLWMAQGYDNMVKYPCLGTSRPPTLSTYDGCAFETFRIWKK